MTNDITIAMMIAIKHAEHGCGGGVQEGGTWLDREIGHNPATGWSQNSVTNSVTNFSGCLVRQGISQIQLKHTREKSLELITINSKAVVLIISHKYNIE